MLTTTKLDARQCCVIQMHLLRIQKHIVLISTLVMFLLNKIVNKKCCF